LSHKLEMGERRSRASHYTLTSDIRLYSVFTSREHCPSLL